MTNLENKQHQLLQRLEWSAADFEREFSLCPICAGTRPDHSPECYLAYVLRLVALTATPDQKKHYLEGDWSEYNVPLCPTCGSKAVHKSSLVELDHSRVCWCDSNHTWVMDAQGVEI